MHLHTYVVNLRARGNINMYKIQPSPYPLISLYPPNLRLRQGGMFIHPDFQLMAFCQFICLSSFPDTVSQTRTPTPLLRDGKEHRKECLWTSNSGTKQDRNRFFSLCSVTFNP